MVRRNLARSRTEAQRLIASGVVSVDGFPARRAAGIVTSGSLVEVDEDGPRWVSRGALKLVAALDAFDVVVAGVEAIDVGSSTGGFTEVLLDRGAEHVTCLDVGSDQFDDGLRSDPRISLWEQTNVRGVDVGEIGGPFDLVVVDLSFISLTVVANDLAELAKDDADLVVLVKPQFEVQRADLGKGGILRDSVKRLGAVQRVMDALTAAGLGCRDIVQSPVDGGDGNVEFLLLCSKGAEGLRLEVPS